MATTRLRKTFHYPGDDSEDDEVPKDLDEEGPLYTPNISLVVD